MAITNHINIGNFWLITDNRSRFSNSPVCVHSFLVIMIILGISAFYHDSAACIINNSKILAAVQEERFTRKKHDSSFPENSIKYCIKESGVNVNDIKFIVFYDKPFLKFERLLETYLAFAPRGFISFLKSLPLWVKEKIFQKIFILKNLKKVLGTNINLENKLLFSEHHLSHASSAFFPSPFKKAAILTMDAVGEWTTTSIASGNGNKIKMLKEINFPHSLGLLYSAFTYYTGFKVNSGEYKLMGLAPYGKSIYYNKIIKNLIDIKSDGSFRLNMEYFNYCVGLTMTNTKFHNLFGGPPRLPESKISQRHMDIAASIQLVVEDIIIKICKYIKKETNMENICLAGGVALNCVANGRLLKEKIFKKIWIQPAAGDSGGALGAALAINYIMLKNERIIKPNEDSMMGSYLGPSFSNKEIEKTLKKFSAKYIKIETEELVNLVSNDLANGKVIGWMQGRMEFGPRALGSRSIIADPRSSLMQKKLNLKVKFRESFRPFAPSVLLEELSEWFKVFDETPYMLIVGEVSKSKLLKIPNDFKNLEGFEKLHIKRSVIPAVTHIDNSARIQTVNKKFNPLYHSLISKFREITNCPIIVNTSFNVRGEPIVCSPKDAYKCFMKTEIDILVIGNYYLIKEKQDQQNNYFNKKSFLAD